MHFSIRTSVEADHSEIMRIWLDASRIGHPFLCEEELAYQKEEIETKYLGHVEMWVAETDNKKILGFIGLIDNFIGGLFVDPVHHRHGIGKKLVLWARELKKVPLEVDVFLENESARKFYNKLDFLSEYESLFEGKKKNYPQYHMIQYQ